MTPTPKTTPLCFGGSFNPIHNGHLLVARAVAESQGFERVLLIPSAQPPHKPQSADLAPAQERLRMCELIAQTDPWFECDGLELHRQGPSYTIDTVHELKRRGWDSVHWMIGADMLLYLPKWRSYLELLQGVTFWIAKRPGWIIEWDQLPTELRFLESQVVTTPMIEISSTQIRQRIQSRQSIRYLVPPIIENHILSNRLFGSGKHDNTSQG